MYIYQHLSQSSLKLDSVAQTCTDCTLVFVDQRRKIASVRPVYDTEDIQDLSTQQDPVSKYKDRYGLDTYFGNRGLRKHVLGPVTSRSIDDPKQLHSKLLTQLG